MTLAPPPERKGLPVPPRWSFERTVAHENGAPPARKVGLTDESEMPFGKYKDVKMKDVPASYLNWLYNNGVGGMDGNAAVYIYICDNMQALEKEYPDGIWLPFVVLILVGILI